MFKMLCFCSYLIINKKDIQFVHELLDSPSYIRRKVSFYLAMIIKCFSLLQNIIEDITYGLVRMYVTPFRYSWTIFLIRFGTKLYRQIVGIPIDTKCARLAADLFLF